MNEWKGGKESNPRCFREIRVKRAISTAICLSSLSYICVLLL